MEQRQNFRVHQKMLATNWQRFANYILDLIAHYILMFIVYIGIGFIGALMGYNDILLWMQNISDLESYLIYFSIMIPYYVFLESYSSRTIAKYLTKTMVVMQDGSKPDVGTAFKRTFSRLIPFDALSFLGSNGRGWHDTISDTYVVKKDIFEQEKELFYSLGEIGNTAE